MDRDKVEFLDRVNQKLTDISRASDSWNNHASISWCGLVGGSSGTISFGIRDNMSMGEYDFRSHDECLSRLEHIYSLAVSGRV